MVANRVFDILVRSYFDDFPVVGPAALADFMAAALTKILKLLGWAVKPNGEKAEVMFP